MNDDDDKTTKEWKKLEQDDVKEDHQLELQDNYIQDEKYDDSED
ncbi:hypothetical protein [Nitrosopumilus sp. b3]|nr:hypothetical protein [Nitrosopumilus sp. b3]